MIIYKAILKNGYENIQLLILEYCDGDVKVLLEREQFYIDTFKPEYNILSQSGSSYGYSHTEETKEKFKNRKFTAETRLKLSQSAEGRILDAATRMKISVFHKGKVLSEETKSKISKFRTEISGVKVEVTNLLPPSGGRGPRRWPAGAGEINRYDSLTLASIDFPPGPLGPSGP